MPGFRKKSRRNRSRRKSLKRRQSRRNRTNGGRRYRQRGGGKPKEIYDKYVKELKIQLPLISRDSADTKGLSEHVDEYLVAVEAKLKTGMEPSADFDSDEFKAGVYADANDAESKWTAYLEPIKKAVKAVHDAENPSSPAPAAALVMSNEKEKDLIEKFETFIGNKTIDLDDAAAVAPAAQLVIDAKNALDLARRGPGGSGSGSGGPGGPPPGVPQTVTIVSSTTVVEDKDGKQHTVETERGAPIKLTVTPK